MVWAAQRVSWHFTGWVRNWVGGTSFRGAGLIALFLALQIFLHLISSCDCLVTSNNASFKSALLVKSAA